MPPDAVRILAVDDVPENLAALEALLADENVELVRARSGLEALELLLVEDDFALALLDVQMPGMDGFELAELMRGTERTRRIPIIFLTALATDERRKFRGYETGAVDYLLKPLDTQIIRNKVQVFVELYRQRVDLARQRDELAGALARLNAHNDNSPLAIVELDPEHRVVAWSKGAERLFGWRSAEVEGFGVSDFKWLAPDDAGTFADLIAEIIGGRTHRATRTVSFCTAEGFALVCECYCSALLDSFGRLISVNLQILDVTERKRADETRRLLIGELNHRVKNTLASVQAIAQQTLRHSSGPSAFAPTFLGRIHALAGAHSLLSGATWQGAGLRELIRGQLEIGAIGAERFLASGPDLDLAPEPALHLALVLHELVTNACKYGALSEPGGTVRLEWRVRDNLLELDWEERGGPPVAAPSRTGFGSALIERSLQADGGTAVADYRAEGVRWRLTLPYLARPRAPKPRGQRLRATNPGANAASGASSARAAPRPIEHRRILIVEDEPLVAMELAAIIEEGGGTVVASAASVAEATEVIAAETLDCVLLDGNLHGAPVDAIAIALRDKGVPFLFVSGYGRESLPGGFDDVPLVAKPFDARQLMKEVGALFSPAPSPASPAA